MLINFPIFFTLRLIRQLTIKSSFKLTLHPVYFDTILLTFSIILIFALPSTTAFGKLRACGGAGVTMGKMRETNAGLKVWEMGK